MQDVILKNMDCMDFLPTIKSGGGRYGVDRYTV